ncbi:MAG: hypothetical protein PHC41_00515 [Lachnospiraceae bacterium]|nr:hypothetical protein [Lachnospiraceae bacterium]MDD3614686.1 hypothetical protein [Lachnospiraceae bacterium]
MKKYEVVWEIFNPCEGNQMRDVFFDEVETDDIDGYVKGKYKDKNFEYDKTQRPDGTLIYDIVSAGMKQRYTVSEI